MYACWYPVGSPEYRERRAELDAATDAARNGTFQDVS